MNIVNIALLYAHEDEKEYADELIKELRILRRQTPLDLEIWSMKDIPIGEYTNTELKQVIKSTQYAIYLISSDFLCDEDYLHTIQLAKEQDKTSIVPIIIRPCQWKKEPLIKGLQILPRNKIPVSQHSHRDIIWQEIIREIEYLIESNKNDMNTLGSQDEEIANLEKMLSQGDYEGIKKIILPNKIEQEEAEKRKRWAKLMLIRAKAIARDFNNVKGFEEAKECFECSLGYNRNEQNLFEYARFLQIHQESNAALVLYEEVKQLYNDTPEKDTQTHLLHLAKTLNNLGILHKHKNNFRAAYESYQDALVIKQRLVELAPERYKSDLAISLTHLASLVRLQNKSEAEELYKKAIPIQHKLAEGNQEIHLQRLAETLNNFGVLKFHAGDLEKAGEVYQKALKVRKKLAHRKPQTYSLDVADTLHNIGSLRQTEKKNLKAKKFYEDALKIYKKWEKIESTTYWSQLATVLDSLGGTQMIINPQLEEAEKYYKEALKIRKKLAEQEPQTYSPDVAQTLNNLGSLYKERRHFKKAKKPLEDALAMRRELEAKFPENSLIRTHVAQTLYNLSHVYEGLKNRQRATDTMLKAITLLYDYKKTNYEYMMYYNKGVQFLKERGVSWERL